MAHRPDSRQLLESLEERDFIQIDHDEFHFKSELIREIAYGTLTKAERARRHAALAPVLAVAARSEVPQAPTTRQAAHVAAARTIFMFLGAGSAGLTRR